MKQNEHYFRVQWGDTDAAGIVFYPNFFKWQDSSAHEFFRSIGHSSPRLMAEHYMGWPIVDTKCSFLRPLFFDDEITVVTSVEEIGSKSISLSNRFLRNGDEVAVGYEVRVCTIFEPGKPPRGVQIPEYILDAIKS
jgi:4-hydroxybenzoyl-CoA thioesterase